MYFAKGSRKDVPCGIKIDFVVVETLHHLLEPFMKGMAPR